MKNMLNMNEKPTSKISFARYCSSRSIHTPDQGEELDGLNTIKKIAQNPMILGLVGALIFNPALPQEQKEIMVLAYTTMMGLIIISGYFVKKTTTKIRILKEVSKEIKQNTICFLKPNGSI